MYKNNKLKVTSDTNRVNIANVHHHLVTTNKLKNCKNQRFKSYQEDSYLRTNNRRITAEQDTSGDINFYHQPRTVHCSYDTTNWKQIAISTSNHFDVLSTCSYQLQFNEPSPTSCPALPPKNYSRKSANYPMKPYLKKSLSRTPIKGYPLG